MTVNVWCAFHGSDKLVSALLLLLFGCDSNLPTSLLWDSATEFSSAASVSGDWNTWSCSTKIKLDTVTWNLVPLFTLLRNFSCSSLAGFCSIFFVLHRAQLLFGEGLTLTHFLRYFQAHSVPFCSYAMLGHTAEDKFMPGYQTHHKLAQFLSRYIKYGLLWVMLF